MNMGNGSLSISAAASDITSFDSLSECPSA